MPPTVALAPVQPTDGNGRVGAALSHIGEAAQPTSCPDQDRLDDGSVSAIQHCTSEAASPLSIRPSHPPENCERQNPTQVCRWAATEPFPTADVRCAASPAELRPSSPFRRTVAMFDSGRSPKRFSLAEMLHRRLRLLSPQPIREPRSGRGFEILRNCGRSPIKPRRSSGKSMSWSPRPRFSVGRD
jgi:hypothetical protein